jgi:hypothetical protein
VPGLVSRLCSYRRQTVVFPRSGDRSYIKNES